MPRDRSGSLLSVFHNRRWDGDYLTLREALRSGLIGEPRLFEVGIWRWGAPRGWRGQSAAVGTIMHDWGAHFVDQMFQLVPGPVTSVRAQAQRDWPDLDIESYLAAEMTFDNGVVYRLELANRARAGKPHWFVVGDRGALTKEGVDPQEAAMLKGDISAAQEPVETYVRVTAEMSGTVGEIRLRTIPGDWMAYYRNIADALEGTAPLAATAEEARRGVILLEAVQEALRTGQVVRPEGGI